MNTYDMQIIVSYARDFVAVFSLDVMIYVLFIFPFFQSPVVETSGNFNSMQKSAMINMTLGQMTYFEVTHREGNYIYMPP